MQIYREIKKSNSEVHYAFQSPAINIHGMPIHGETQENTNSFVVICAFKDNLGLKFWCKFNVSFVLGSTKILVYPTVSFLYRSSQHSIVYDLLTDWIA